MVVISKAILMEFALQHPDVRQAVEKWYADAKAADWKRFSDIKKTFNSADYAGNDRYVFDIRGNRYRLVALIFFKVRTVFILFVGTHQQYDQIDAATINFKK